MISSLILREIL